MDAVEQIVAIEDIRRLKARYCHLIDGKEWPAYGDLFTEDAVMEMGTIRAEGREAIVDFVSTAIGEVKTAHNAHSPAIDIHSDQEASATWGITFVQEQNKMNGWGFYYETYRRAPGGPWQIATFAERTTFFSGTDVVLEAVVEAG